MKSWFLIPGLLFWTQLSASTLAEEAKAPAPPVARDAAKPADVFTLIVLPDTQGYADTRHREFVVLTLEFKPRDEALARANRVAERRLSGRRETRTSVDH